MIGQIFQDIPNNCYDFFCKLRYANALTDVGFGGVLGIVFLMIIGFSLFFMMKSFKSEAALSVSLLITSVIGMLFRLGSFVNDFVLYVCIAIFIYSLFLLRKDAALYEN